MVYVLLASLDRSYFRSELDNGARRSELDDGARFWSSQNESRSTLSISTVTALFACTLVLTLLANERRGLARA